MEILLQVGVKCAREPLELILILSLKEVKLYLEHPSRDLKTADLDASVALTEFFK